MLSRIFSFLSSRDKSLSRALNPQKKVKIEGIVFIIRKLNPLDYLAGYKAIQQSFTTYLSNPEKNPLDISPEKIKSHYVDVFTSAVIEPKLTRKGDQESLKQALNVDALFNNWDICQSLYDAIMVFTYGKKKARRLGFQKKSWSS